MAAVLLLLVLLVVTVGLLFAYAVWLFRRSGRWNRLGAVCAIVAAICIVAVWICVLLIACELPFNQLIN